VHVRLTYRKPGITEREPAVPDSLSKREPKSPMIARPATDKYEPLQTTRVLTGQHVISSAGNGASNAFNRARSAGSSPSHSCQT
jgi:hypothetical protein